MKQNNNINKQMLTINNNNKNFQFTDISKVASKSSNNTPDDFLKDLKKPRKVTFYKNGDRYFNGKPLTITPARYVTFRELMSDLNRSVDLPYGVRRIFTPTTGRELHDIEELQDGSSYVCASFEPFRSVKYGEWAEKPWNAHLSKSLSYFLFYHLYSLIIRGFLKSKCSLFLFIIIIITFANSSNYNKTLTNVLSKMDNKTQSKKKISCKFLFMVVIKSKLIRK